LLYRGIDEDDFPERPNMKAPRDSDLPFGASLFCPAKITFSLLNLLSPKKSKGEHDRGY
jgi:hypothetical protein